MVNQLSQEDLIELIYLTAQKLNLQDTSVVEKDYYATQVIQALADIEDEHFRLVFAGGTSLAKAYHIVKRMSEDVDFKIQYIQPDPMPSKYSYNKKLKVFREKINHNIKVQNFRY